LIFLLFSYKSFVKMCFNDSPKKNISLLIQHPVFAKITGNTDHGIANLREELKGDKLVKPEISSNPADLPLPLSIPPPLSIPLPLSQAIPPSIVPSHEANNAMDEKISQLLPIHSPPPNMRRRSSIVDPLNLSSAYEIQIQTISPPILRRREEMKDEIGESKTDSIETSSSSLVRFTELEGFLFFFQYLFA
jgi:hypothetical protein